MGLIAAVGAYIFTAYTLGKPAHAPFASFLGGVVTFLVGWFCLSLVDDVWDLSFRCLFDILICVLALIHCTCVIVSTLIVGRCTRQRYLMLYVLVPAGTRLSLLTWSHSLKVGPQPHAQTTHAYECIIGHFLGDISSLNICDAFEHSATSSM
jgi:hypothetical protein